MKASILTIWKIFLRVSFALLALPFLYLLIAFSLSSITINASTTDNVKKDKTVYLATNGMHVDIIVPIEFLDEAFLKDMVYDPRNKYMAFGWGDENFYLNTPTWNDLTFSNAFKALFLKSETLLHVTRYNSWQKGWQKIPITHYSEEVLLTYIANTFDTHTGKKELVGKGYGTNDDFYKAQGTYTCFNTCNTWVNTALIKSDLPACLWTPFDFTILNKYK